MKSLTTIAQMPSGAGSSSTPPAEVMERPAPPAMPAAREETTAHAEPSIITMETMKKLGQALDRMRSREAAQRQGFEPFEYTERN